MVPKWPRIAVFNAHLWLLILASGQCTFWEVAGDGSGSWVPTHPHGRLAWDARSRSWPLQVFAEPDLEPCLKLCICCSVCLSVELYHLFLLHLISCCFCLSDHCGASRGFAYFKSDVHSRDAVQLIMCIVFLCHWVWHADILFKVIAPIFTSFLYMSGTPVSISCNAGLVTVSSCVEKTLFFISEGRLCWVQQSWLAVTILASSSQMIKMRNLLIV